MILQTKTRLDKGEFMGTIKELGDWLEEDSRRKANCSVPDEGVFKISLLNGINIPVSESSGQSLSGAITSLCVPHLKYEAGDYVCECCFKVSKGTKAEPVNWGNGLCNTCREILTLAELPLLGNNYGRYAKGQDPRKLND